MFTMYKLKKNVCKPVFSYTHKLLYIYINMRYSTHNVIETYNKNARKRDDFHTRNNFTSTIPDNFSYYFENVRIYNEKITPVI